MSKSRVNSVKNLKNFLATNRIAQVVAILGAIVVLWVAYISIASLLSTIRSQSLLEAISATLSEEYHQMAFDLNMDSQTSGLSIVGDIYKQDDRLGAEAVVRMNQVNQPALEVDLKASSTEGGQYIHFGDLSTAENYAEIFAPGSKSAISRVSDVLGDSWMRVSEVDGKCFANITSELSDKQSELSKAVASSYLKSPLMRVHSINTLQDGGRDYYISPIMSNMKGFARGIKDSKAINRIDDCESVVSMVNTLATMPQKNVDELQATELSGSDTSFTITTKSGKMTNVRSVMESEGSVARLDISFSGDKAGRDISQPDLDNLVQMSDIEDDLQDIAKEAQRLVEEQSQAMEREQSAGGTPPQFRAQ